MAGPDDNAEREATPASFEDSLAELQRIVGDLEDGSVGLEESMRRFEQGVRLLRQCYKVLEQAEQKIEILTGSDAAGIPVIAPFDASATHEQSSAAGRRRTTKVKAVETRVEVESVEEPDDECEEESGPRLF